MRARRHWSLILVPGLIAVLPACGDDSGPTNQNNQINANQNQAVCGNGQLDLGEQCDDGAQNSDVAPDACRTTCRTAHCGDGVVDTGEVCDDGDDGTNRSDDCPSTCLAPVCGDGHVWLDHEACDDGNTVSGDGCREDCLQDETQCGNGTRDPGEACDGASLGGQTCSTLGLGVGSLACRADCTFDTSGCVQAECGNNVTESVNGEECDGTDLGGQSCFDRGFLGGGSLGCTAGCRFDASSCQSLCGNRIVEPDEGCDDGGTRPTDGCNALCQVEPGFTCAGNPSQCAPTRCGDGIQAVSTDATVVGEACDDGDTDPGDGCDGSCALEPGWDCQGAAPTVCTSVCGDGLRVGAEVCDGADFGGQTCGDQGYDGGVLLCDPGCGQVDPRGCFDCGDGVCSPGEPGHCAADCPVARVRGSAQFACALRADGTVRCWGMNGSSQLGLAADYVPRYLPSRVPGITGAVDLAVGDRHACVVLGSGAVWCWGVNDSGQLGIGETSTHRPPVQVPGLATAVAVAAGGWHTCALLADGTVRCFGSNHSGQLGDGTQEDRASPVTVAGLGNVASLAAGWNHTCARLVDGAVRCWGDNGEGQLGDGTTNPALHPVAVVGIDRALEVSAGGAHTCALGAGGVPWCWGANWAGQVGNGSLDAQPTPVAVGLTGIVSLSTGAFFTCAVDADGATSCWGNDEEGQLGDGTITSAQPTPVPASLLPLAAAQVGGGHWSNCAILADGKVRCWGDGNSGLIGDATWAERLTPSEVPGLTSRCGDGVCDLYEMGCPAECHATSVSTGVHTCASRSEGTVWCWGNNSSGELAAGMTWHAVTAPYPATVLRDVIAVGVSYSSAYQMGAALTGAGQVWRWPEDRNAGLFDPVPVPLAGNAIHLGVGQHHTCVVLAGGAVWCWGGGWEGQLGTGSTSPAEVEDPVLATVVTGAASVAAGDLHTCAVLSGGAVRCWGGNQQGQCGSGDTTSPQLSGVTVSGLTAATVAPGGTHTCALGTGGTVSCWGANGSGQCGTGAQSGPVLVPTAVNLGQGATALAAGVSFTCAVLVDGTVRCWGSNDSGQLGDGNGGSVPYSPAPVVVAGLDDVVEVACGIMTTCARKTDHSLWCWGGNYQGQLGDGTQLDRTSPVQVLPLSW